MGFKPILSVRFFYRSWSRPLYQSRSLSVWMHPMTEKVTTISIRVLIYIFYNPVGVQICEKSICFETTVIQMAQTYPLCSHFARIKTIVTWKQNGYICIKTILQVTHRRIGDDGNTNTQEVSASTSLNYQTEITSLSSGYSYEIKVTAFSSTAESVARFITVTTGTPFLCE